MQSIVYLNRHYKLQRQIRRCSNTANNNEISYKENFIKEGTTVAVVVMAMWKAAERKVVNAKL